MTLEELTPWLYSRVTGGIRWGLDRTEAILAGAGDPHRRFRSLLIGGTNGKGSVAALCDAALRDDGRHRIGLYTSPHLVSMTERVRIDGVPVAAADLARVAERLRPDIERTGASFFEATTAIGFVLLAEAGVEIAVVEVGLGGRLDATNVLDPLVSAVTNVALEHTDYLGDTIQEIAKEKGGIFRAGVPAITAAEDPRALRVLREVAAAAGAPFEGLEERASYSILEEGVGGSRFELGSRAWGVVELAVPLPGLHQVRNAALAAEILALLPADVRPPVDAVRRGFAAVRWPGRLQVERVRGTTYLLDVAHNPAGAEVLAASISALDLPRPIVLVAGILRDKNHQEMLNPLARVVDALVLTTPQSAPESRRWDPAQAAGTLRLPDGSRPRIIGSLPEALGRAATLAPHGTVVVTGSVYTVGEALQELGIPAI